VPGLGDRYVDGFAFGPDGRIYFGVGTATNSGVVGKVHTYISNVGIYQRMIFLSSVYK
jgi:hypothetical protein